MKSACKRLVGTEWNILDNPYRWFMIPFDVQLVGGIVLHEGSIAEMTTGEGKTLVSTMPAYLNALAGSGVGLMIPAGEGISTIGCLAERVDNPIIIEGFRYDRLAEAIVVLEQRDNVCIESHLLNSPNFVELLKAEGLLDRLIFGSYAPLAYVGAATAPIESADVSDDEKAMIFGGNIRRILG